MAANEQGSLALSCRTDPLRLAQCRPRVADGFGGQDQAPPDCGGVTPERVQRRVLEDFESPHRVLETDNDASRIALYCVAHSGKGDRPAGSEKRSKGNRGHRRGARCTAPPTGRSRQVPLSGTGALTKGLIQLI